MELRFSQKNKYRPFAFFVSLPVLFRCLPFAVCLLPFALRLFAVAQPPTISLNDCAPMRPIPSAHWRGEYFNNRELTGTPLFVRNDGKDFLDFDWGLQSPAPECGLNADEFSVRWTRTVAFAAGVYRFTLTTDDGARLFIDGKEQLNHWRDQPLTSYTIEVPLTAGNHQLKIEYYEHFGSAIAKLEWSAHPCLANVPPDHWRGEYFNSNDLSGSPISIRNEGDGALSVDERASQTLAGCGLRGQDTSVRWSRRVTFGSGAYRFNLQTGAAARVLVDGQIQVDQWTAPTSGNRFFDLRLEAGNHLLVIEARSAKGAPQLNFAWRTLPCLDTVAEDHWRGEYFNNEALSGQPVMVRDDGDGHLDFNWGEESPAATCNLTRDGFSVRWTRNATFTRGVHRFVIAGNDGVRFYLDGELKLEQWHEQSASYLIDIDLSVGRHQLKLEYNDLGGRASVKLAWQPLPCLNNDVPTDHWRGEYFDNPSLSGRPRVVRDEGLRLDFAWGLQGPHADCATLTDNFSARWTRTATFAAGTYRFTVSGDDGVRLFVDGKKLLDEWRPQFSPTFSRDLELTAGDHRIVLEFFENYGSAQVKLSWAVAPCTAVVAAERWRGEYFNNPDLQGKPSLVRDDGDGNLQFDWRQKSPDSNCGIASDNFSARWTRTVTFGNGGYRFALAADDGLRFYIDGQLKLDRWQSPAASYTLDLPMTAGNHQLQFEFRDTSDTALAQLSWEPHPCWQTVATTRWRGEYFDNPAWSGKPRAIRDDGDGMLNFAWGAQSPHLACYVGPQDFSVRWTRTVILAQGVYRLTVASKDQVQLWVNGKKVLEGIGDNLSVDLTLPNGSHTILLQQTHRQGEAGVKLSWQKIG